MIGMLVFVPAAFAQADLNCDDFDSQADAQATLDADPSDPNNLDADDDGLACEDFFGGVDPEPTPPEPTTPETTTTETATPINDADDDQYATPTAPAPAPSEAAAATVLPDTGGASVIALAAGALLIAGGIIARRR